MCVSMFNKRSDRTRERPHTHTFDLEHLDRLNLLESININRHQSAHCSGIDSVSISHRVSQTPMTRDVEISLSALKFNCGEQY